MILIVVWCVKFVEFPLTLDKTCNLYPLQLRCLFSGSVQSLVFVFDWQLQEEVDCLADRLELANNALKGDWSRWRNSMRTDLKSAFLSAAEKNIDHYEKVSSNFTPWEIYLYI